MPCGRLRSPCAKTLTAVLPSSTIKIPSIFQSSTNRFANLRSSLLSRSIALSQPLIVHPITTPGASMENRSIRNPTMSRTNSAPQLRLSLWGRPAGQKKRAERSPLCPAVSSLDCCSGRSPALPYPAAKFLQFSSLFLFWKGTFLLCRKGDISTLH